MQWEFVMVGMIDWLVVGVGDGDGDWWINDSMVMICKRYYENNCILCGFKMRNPSITTDAR